MAIGPSGLVKLRRLELAVEWIKIEAMEGPNKNEVKDKAENAKTTIAKLSTPLRKEKNRRQIENLEDLSEHIPDVEEVAQVIQYDLTVETQ